MTTSVAIAGECRTCQAQVYGWAPDHFEALAEAEVYHFLKTGCRGEMVRCKDRPDPKLGRHDNAYSYCECLSCIQDRRSVRPELPPLPKPDLDLFPTVWRD